MGIVFRLVPKREEDRPGAGDRGAEMAAGGVEMVSAVSSAKATARSPAEKPEKAGVSRRTRLLERSAM